MLRLSHHRAGTAALRLHQRVPALHRVTPARQAVLQAQRLTQARLHLQRGLQRLLRQRLHVQRQRRARPQQRHRVADGALRRIHRLQRLQRRRRLPVIQEEVRAQEQRRHVARVLGQHGLQVPRGPAPRHLRGHGAVQHGGLRAQRQQGGGVGLHRRHQLARAVRVSPQAVAHAEHRGQQVTSLLLERDLERLRRGVDAGRLLGRRRPLAPGAGRRAGGGSEAHRGGPAVRAQQRQGEHAGGATLELADEEAVLARGQVHGARGDGGQGALEATALQQRRSVQQHLVRRATHRAHHVRARLRHLRVHRQQVQVALAGLAAQVHPAIRRAQRAHGERAEGAGEGARQRAVLAHRVLLVPGQHVEGREGSHQRHLAHAAQVAQRRVPRLRVAPHHVHGQARAAQQVGGLARRARRQRLVHPLEDVVVQRPRRAHRVQHVPRPEHRQRVPGVARRQFQRGRQRPVRPARAPREEVLSGQRVRVARVLRDGRVEALLRQHGVTRHEVRMEARERERAGLVGALLSPLGGGLEDMGRDGGGGLGAARQGGDEGERGESATEGAHRRAEG